MSYEDNKGFTPEHIDEQIEQLQSTPTISAYAPKGAQTVQTLHRYYAPQADAGSSLERVWQRFEERRAVRHEDEEKTPKPVLRLVRSEHEVSLKPLQRYPKHVNQVARRLGMIAAVVFVTILVGSMLAVFQLARHASTTGSPSGSSKMTPANVDSGEIYASADDVLYRLNPATYQPIWSFPMHPIGGYGYAQIAGQAVNHIYYFWGTDTDSYYYYALNTSNGSLRWRFKLPDGNELMFSGQQLIDHGVAYISEYSLTKGYSLVIALDASTGHQLWQQRYNNTGIDLGEKHSTDYATGLQLEAVSNGTLYAASSTRKNGKATFSLYALSGKDGSTVWQKTRSTSERVYEATVANNMLFTINVYSNSSNADTWSINAYDTATGNIVWSAPLDGQGGMTGQGQGLTTYDGYVFIETAPTFTSASVYALNERDGLVVYQKNFAPGGNSSITIEQGVIYVVATANDKATLTIIYPLTGRKPVTYGLPSGVSMEVPPAIQRNPVTGEVQIYVSMSPNQVDVLRGADGKILRTITLGQPVHPHLFDYVLVTVIA